MSILKESIGLVEGANWGDDFELELFKCTELIKKINNHFSNDKIDSRTFQSISQATDWLEKVLKRL